MKLKSNQPKANANANAEQVVKDIRGKSNAEKHCT